MRQGQAQVGAPCVPRGRHCRSEDLCRQRHRNSFDDVDAAPVINALGNSVPSRLETLGAVDFGLDTSGVISQTAESEQYLDGALQLQLASARGDEAALLEWFRSSGLASYYQHTITARNPDLLRKIDRLIRDGKERPVFFALGAAHLPGQEGLVSGLRKLGWTVKRLCQ